MNILLVDDDRFIIEALREKIRWARLKIDNVYAANSLTQAQAIIKEYPIHLMISDIEMPQGSGLELLSWVRNENYDIKTIFLTNYADFNYAQKAIELQSFEYYLKPINFEKLEFIIQKALDKITEQRPVAPLETFFQAENNFWFEYLRKPRIHRLEELQAELRRRNLSLKDHQYFLTGVITLHINEADYAPEIPSWTSQLKKVFQAFSNETYQLASLFKMEGHVDHYVCLFRVDNSINSETFARKIQQEIQDKLRHNSIITFNSCFQCPNILQDVKELYAATGQQVPYWNTIIPVSSDAAVIQEKEVTTNSISFSDSLDESELSKSLLHYISGGMVPKSILQKLHLDWTQQIGIYLDQNGISAHKLFQNAHHDFLFQRKFHSIESFEEYFNYYWSHARNFVTDAENQKNSIQRIIEYIDHHYKEDLSRTTLADMVYLSADHLARVFKKETGETLVKYITDKRIHAAKELLLDTKTPISQVASEVGYDNYSYFTKIFKEKTGVSPGDYRKQQAE
ncbi:MULTISPECIES: helix-turn-helix domain-containing protein [unclassified Granulicatella]|uniref:helix-turn-helix domain-containing protein n=1 Tax=unclassified Granulicatella TaxID=2630493 RepID=UPI002552E986|nr:MULTISPECIES: helix-turn-helix domain-containing protein [unclassified Granulicatella]MDK8380684.1 helix-turn-helix domain-containing protein [Granulicatella sp. UMB5615B]MDK8523059.1 helix-turn-helix domain-containing protein [Granulicatella sp. UMB5615A]